MSKGKNLIIDPSFFVYPNAASTLLESLLPNEYNIVIPTLIYGSLSERDSEKFISTLSRWERTTRFRLEKVWSEIGNVSSLILDNTIPCDRVLEELSPEKHFILETIESALRIPERIREPDLLCLEMAKEMIETACVASLIVSVSDKAKRWYQRFSRAVVKRVEDNDTLMKAKEETRDKMKAVGWKGSVLIWFCKHIPIPFLGDAIDTVLILSTNGAYRCQNCGKSLWRLPRDIFFCPYCSKSL